MTGWLTLTDEQRKTSIEQAAVLSGITAKAIEKDWWVTLILKILFSASFSSNLVFKGGTSLSKGWKIIHRFSEDIDIALSPDAFGLKYQTHPSHSYLKKLKREGCFFTTTIIRQALEVKFEELGLPLKINVLFNRTIPDKDPQTLFVKYESLYPAHPYLIDEVKLEFGVRSSQDSGREIKIQSILHEVYPNIVYHESPFLVRSIEPEKTFLEKLFLLHEKFCSPNAVSPFGQRHSRHLYDIFKMLNTSVEKKITDSPEFYERLLEHRKYYVRLKNVDYDCMRGFKLSFVPPDNVLSHYRKDYETMKTEMIYSIAPDFEEMINELKRFQTKLLSLKNVP